MGPYPDQTLPIKQIGVVNRKKDTVRERKAKQDVARTDMFVPYIRRVVRRRLPCKLL